MVRTDIGPSRASVEQHAHAGSSVLAERPECAVSPLIVSVRLPMLTSLLDISFDHNRLCQFGSLIVMSVLSIQPPWRLGSSLGG